MKKIVCISLCVLLCVPLLALSAFAEDVLETDSSSLRSVVSSSSLSNFTFSLTPSRYRFHTLVIDGVTYIDATFESDISSFVIPLSVGSHSISGSVWANSTTSRPIYPFFGDTPFSSDSSSPLSIPFSDYISIVLSHTSDVHLFYFNLEEPTPLYPVDNGVSSFIGFCGDVLHFITNNSAILTLLGLSVALCLVIPFGISKLKELVKGY